MMPDRFDENLAEKRRRLRDNYQCDDGIVRTPESCMNQVCDKVRRVAPYDVSVLLSGESGTGKELAARALHYNSLRWYKPFIVENCGALDPMAISEDVSHGWMEHQAELKHPFNGVTLWNFSPRDAQRRPGALEQALIGTPLRDGEKDPVAVQHIVRSFDPCMVCTAH